MKKNIFILILLLIVFFSFAPDIIAQEGSGNGRLKGYVLDSDKKPIEGATVKIEYNKYNRKLETTTDKKGKFAFLGLGVGEVKLSAVKEGYVLSGNITRVSGAQRNPVQYIKLKKLSEVKPVEDENSKIKNEFTMATSLFNSRKFAEALPLFLSFREKKPDMFNVGINIGNCYLELKKYEDAIKEYKIILEKIKIKTPEFTGNKTAAQIYASIGDIYMRQNKLNKAEEYFKKSIAIDQSDHALAYNIAEILFSANKTEDAIKYYNMAIKIKPDWAKPFKQIGYAYLNKGDMKNAIKMFEKFLALDPNSPEASGIKEVIKSIK